jgi:carboxyl-terminal processing protease
MKLFKGLVCLFLLVVFPVVSFSINEREGDKVLYKKLELFADVINLIQQDYVEEKTPKDLIYGALEGLLGSLDPYSQFLPPDSYNELKVETEGKFGGLGIVIAIKDGMLTVISPLEGTPAYKEGLKAGDRIVRINGESTKGITLLEAVKKLRGKPGTQVKVTVLREEEHKLMDFTITRDIIKIKSVKEKKMLSDKIGYVKLIEFQENTLKDFKKAIEELKKQGMQGLILDLRNNPGGLLDVAVDVSQIFLPKGELIVYTKGRKKRQNMEFKSKGGFFLEEPLIVLINKGTASGAEILSGAVQDNKRGIVMGTASFGKASVQTIIPLRDGSAVRLTTAHYYTPSGKSIFKEGIHPDILIEEKQKEEEIQPGVEEIFKQIEEGKKEITPAKKKEYDIQLLRAIDVMKGLLVYKQAIKVNQ